MREREAGSCNASNVVETNPRSCSRREILDTRSKIEAVVGACKQERKRKKRWRKMEGKRRLHTL